MLMNTYQNRLDALRKELSLAGVDGFIIPLCDEHMSEYVGAYAQRLEWLTGFAGSAGSAVVLTDKARQPSAAIFVDGRYTLQVREQVDGNLYQYQSVPETSVAKWLAKHGLPAQNTQNGDAHGGGGAQETRIGYDPWLASRKWVKSAEQLLAPKNIVLIPLAQNPIDSIWKDRPRPSPAPAFVQPDTLAGETSADKRDAIANWLKEKALDAVVIAALDSIAWLFNIRGTDVKRTPVVLAFAIVHANAQAELFIEPGKINDTVHSHLGDSVKIRDNTEFTIALGALSDKHVAADPDHTVEAIFTALEQGGAIIIQEKDPVILPKAVKNDTEISGQRAAQARDGAAMVRFLHWLSREGPSGQVNEITAAAKLEAFRKGTGELQDLSFDTISGAGPNGAIVHYRVSEETCRKLEPDSVYLVDSGGQYPDGTTDITRTVWIGPNQPPPHVRDAFTRVLKGHIALARATFPEGTTGAQLDTLARQFLWQAGLDYAHGTGHGVGAFLAVHEGPQRIAKSGYDQALLPGMIVSNEPGYYKAGEFGIRIENLILVEEREISGAEGRFLGFETLTLVPIDRALVNVSMLTDAERQWWNDYHANVTRVIGPRLDDQARAWLLQQCKPL